MWPAVPLPLKCYENPTMFPWQLAVCTAETDYVWSMFTENNKFQDTYIKRRALLGAFRLVFWTISCRATLTRQRWSVVMRKTHRHWKHMSSKMLAQCHYQVSLTPADQSLQEQSHVMNYVCKHQREARPDRERLMGCANTDWHRHGGPHPAEWKRHDVVFSEGRGWWGKVII